MGDSYVVVSYKLQFLCTGPCGCRHIFNGNLWRTCSVLGDATRPFSNCGEAKMCLLVLLVGFLSGSSGKEPARQHRRHKRHGFDPWVGKIPWRRKWQLTPVFLPGKSHGWRSLVGYSPWGHKESDMTEQLHNYYLPEPSCFPSLLC